VSHSYQFKEYGSQTIPGRRTKINCKSEGLDTLLKKNIRKTGSGSTDQRHESGRPKHERTEENLTAVNWTW